VDVRDFDSGTRALYLMFTERAVEFLSEFEVVIGECSL
jgi:hypothetical protein